MVSLRSELVNVPNKLSELSYLYSWLPSYKIKSGVSPILATPLKSTPIDPSANFAMIGLFCATLYWSIKSLDSIGISKAPGPKTLFLSRL